jgi:diphthamide biosynthesis protein 7
MLNRLTPQWSVHTELTCNCLLPLDEKTVLVGSYELAGDTRLGRLELLDIPTRKFTRISNEVSCGVFDVTPVNTASYGENKRLLVSCTDGVLRLVEFSFNTDRCPTILPDASVVDAVRIDSEMLTSACCSGCGDSDVSDATREYICSAHLGRLHHVATASTGELDAASLRSWQGHEFDAWCVASSGAAVFYSGGDDGFLRLWDLRTPIASASDACGKMRFDAGVVTIVPPTHLSADGGLATVGSYDEHLYLVDPRSLRRPVTSTGVGGGAWRARPVQGATLDPTATSLHLLLCAAMQGGAALVGRNMVTNELAVLEQFFNTRSDVLCYDVAILPQSPEAAEASTLIVLTCSFYEHLVECYSLNLAAS